MRYIMTVEVHCSEEEIIGVKEQIADAVGITAEKICVIEVKGDEAV